MVLPSSPPPVVGDPLDPRPPASAPGELEPPALLPLPQVKIELRFNLALSAGSGEVADRRDGSRSG